MKPTQHEHVDGGAAEQLPVGSIVMSISDPDPWPIVRVKPAHHGWAAEIEGDTFSLGGTYLVLYRPAPVQPKLGDNLSLEQLEALPFHAGVVGLTGFRSQRMRPPSRGWRSVHGHDADPRDLVIQYAPLVLVWLPPTDGGAS